MKGEKTQKFTRMYCARNGALVHITQTSKSESVLESAPAGKAVNELGGIVSAVTEAEAHEGTTVREPGGINAVRAD